MRGGGEGGLHLRRFLFAEALRILGEGLFALPLFVLFALSGGPAWQATLPFALQRIAGLLALPLGVLADRIPRRELLAAALTLKALIALGLLLKTPILLALCGALFFTLSTLTGLTASAYLADLVGREGLERARGRVGATHIAVDTLKDPFAGLLLLAEGLLLRGLPAYPPPQEARREGMGLRALLAGVGFLLADARLLPLTLYALALGFFSILGLALLPLLALGGGVPPALYGLYPLGLSFGGFLGSLLAGSVGPGLGIWGGHGLKLLGLCALFLPFPLGLLGPLLVGAGGALGGVHLRAFRQRLAPEALLGRVQAGAIALFSAGNLLGALLAGVLGGLGARLPLGLAILGLGLLFLLALGPLHPWRLEALRREGERP